MTEARGKILVLGTADWNQAIATNQHYIVRELAREFPIIYTESMGLRTPEFKMRDIKRMARRIGIGSHPDGAAPRPVPVGVEIRSPKVLPKHTGVAHRFNQPRVHDLVADWIAQPGPRVLWTYTPVTYGLEELATAVVYHCVDLLREGPGIDAALIDRSESHLAAIGTHAIGTSPAVVENLKLRGFGDVEYWPNVADTAVIEDARPAIIERVSKRIVFAGNLIPAKVDFDLLRAVIDGGYDLHLAGPIADGAGNAKGLLEDLIAAGATYHGTLTLPELAELYWTCEVGLIPYVINKLTRGVSPLKTYEYLAAGLGVVSTPVPSVTEVESHVLVRSGHDFVDALDTLAPVGDAARIALADVNSWAGRGNAARELSHLHARGSGESSEVGWSAARMTPELAGKRVLVVARATSLHSNAGGMETSADALVAALHDLGAATSLLTTVLDVGEFPVGYGDHANVWAVSTSRPGRYSKAWWHQARWGGASADWAPDLVLGIGDAARIFASGRHRSPVPVITHAHGTPVMEMQSAAATRTLRGYAKAVLNAARIPSRTRQFRDVDLVLAAGPAIAASMRKPPFSVSAGRLTTVTNSVAQQAFAFDPAARDAIRERIGVPDDQPLYLFIGRLAADKGVEHCIASMAQLDRGHLAIVGDGPSESALRVEAAKSGAADRIVFVGRVPSSESAAWLSAADQMWLLSDRREGLPMTLLEAAANGLPVLTSPTSAAPDDLIGHGISIVKPSEASDHAARAPLPTRGSYLPPAYASTTLAERLSDALQRLTASAR